MNTTILAAIIAASTLVVASILYLLFSGRRRRAALAAGAVEPIAPLQSIRDALRFMAGPLPISVSLHVVVLLALLWGVHMTAGRNLIVVNLRAGLSGGGGDTSQLKHLDLPEMPMPEHSAPLPIERPVVAAASSQSITAATHYVRTVAGGGIGIGRGGGIGAGYGEGIGAGFGGFIGGLRKSGLEVTLVIDGTGSMKLIINDVKRKMEDLVLAIHRLVPTAKIGIVVFGGRGEPIEIQPLTVSPRVLVYFLSNIQARNGGEWQENTLGAVRTAVDKMGWSAPAKKVIVLVGDTPPFSDDMEPTLELVRQFRAENGTFNTVDVTVEEHTRFVIEWARQQGLPPPKKISPLPGFYLQTQHAYQTLAAAGGGSWRSLTRDSQINQQVLILAFGNQWRQDVAAFGRGLIASKSSRDP
ncbi:MAG: vWA domain-containing protein [Candidatus Binataceae bacterium]